jgi:hypothetical protein
MPSLVVTPVGLCSARGVRANLDIRALRGGGPLAEDSPYTDTERVL